MKIEIDNRLTIKDLEEIPEEDRLFEIISDVDPIEKKNGYIMYTLKLFQIPTSTEVEICLNTTSLKKLAKQISAETNEWMGRIISYDIDEFYTNGVRMFKVVWRAETEVMED